MVASGSGANSDNLSWRNGHQYRLDVGNERLKVRTSVAVRHHDDDRDVELVDVLLE
jgi:hypothetical protein